MDNVDFNGVAHLLSPEALLDYQQQVFPFRNELLFVNLAPMLEQDPAYEVFVPLFYFKQESHISNKNDHIKVEPYKVFISNLGRVVNTRKKELEWIEPTLNSNGYHEITVSLGKKKSERLVLARAIACAFLPLGPEVGHLHPKDLQVAHLDGDKANYALSNLKWSVPAIEAETTQADAPATGIVGVLV